MAGKKRAVASDRTQPQLPQLPQLLQLPGPQGNALANARSINSLSLSSSSIQHQAHQSHQSPYSIYSLQQQAQHPTAHLATSGPAPTLASAVGAPVAATSKSTSASTSTGSRGPSTAAVGTTTSSSPSSRKHKHQRQKQHQAQQQLFQEQTQAQAKAQAQAHVQVLGLAHGHISHPGQVPVSIPGPGPGNPGPSAGPGDPEHRTTQPYQNVAPVHHIQPSQPQAQSRTLSSSQPQQQPYPSPNVYTPQSGLQSPFLNNPPQFQTQQAPNDTPNYYTSNPSPRSQHSGGAPYYSTEKPESMAATTMQRPYPPIYNTPQSNSPASVTSPQTHDHGRPMYGQPGSQLSQPLYGYPQYPSMNQVHQPPYATHHAQTQQHQMNSQPMLPYQSNTPQISQGQVAPHHSTISSSPRLKSEASQQYQQTPQARTGMIPQQQQQQQQPQPQQQQQHPGPAPTTASLQAAQQHAAQHVQQQHAQQQQQNQQAPNAPPNPNAAPGPIPATTPLVVRQDGNGVQWIAFEYSRDRVKMEYTIRCDVESVDANALSQEFKSENCVYPRACVPKEQYKGNRLAYETDCNQVGWALAELNTCLRGKRGLIQRAVDSWRNSNQDLRLRSRRVRRQAKMNNRSKLSASGAGQAPGSAGSVSAGLPGPNSMAAPSTRPPGPLSNTPSQILHHHQDVSPTGPESVGAPAYNTGPHGYRQPAAPQHMASPNDIRQGHVFPGYQNYPAVPTSLAPSMAPSMQGGLHHIGRPGGNAAMASKDQDEKDEEDSALFGELPEGKRRKFILVEDTQKSARVRVKVTLDQIEMSEIPDSYRKQNSVFPRAYYPVQMQIGPETSRSDRWVEEGDEVDAGNPTIGKTAVPVSTSDGEADVEVPQISRSKRGREQKLNELGYRMAWGQGRVFSGRPIFLARALDAYRGKQRSALLAAGQEPSSIPAHLETRPGKRKWQERTSNVAQPLTPPTAPSN